MSELKHHTAKVNGIRMHYGEIGSGYPVVLLHGYPETHYAWRKQWPVLAERFHVIVPDLRGYGETDKPDWGYDKRSMANDVRELLRHLGYDRAALVGHDRGARVATRFAKDHRDIIERLVILDNIPTRVVFQSTDAKLARQYWFFFFQQIPHLPEALIAGREEIFLRHFYSSWCYNPAALSDDEVAVYVRAYSQPGALRGAFNDYRAGPIDLAQDTEDADRLIECPTLTMWGAEFELVGGAFDVLDVWRQVARNVRGVAIPECGHLPQEERPDVVNRELLEFLQPLRDVPEVRTRRPVALSRA
jgi:pimeloyl-ACP methyl ester carboxylesterase